MPRIRPARQAGPEDSIDRALIERVRCVACEAYAEGFARGEKAGQRDGAIFGGLQGFMVGVIVGGLAAGYIVRLGLAGV